MSRRRPNQKTHTMTTARARRGPQQRPATIDPTAYDARVLLTPCPTCDAQPGDRCRRKGRGRYGASQFTAEPHLPRVEAARP